MFPPNSDDDSRQTRRKFIGTAAALSAVGLAGCAGSDSTPTETAEPTMTDTPTDTPTETETETATPKPPAPDVPILNYALTLEHLENAFYRDGLAEFSDDELMNADALSKFNETVRMQVPEYLKTVGAHEKAHVDALSATIEKLNGEAVVEGEYEFGYNTPSEFLAIGQALEDTGVAAYAGAAPKVVNNDLLTVAAGIHSVEARHAAFLRLVNDDNPFPNAVDKAKSVNEVLEIAGQFVTSEVNPSVYELEDDRPTHDRKMEDGTSDVNVLNYALTLEHLENAFYREGLNTFSDSELMDAEVLMDYGQGIREKVPGHLAIVGEHEAAHVSAITDTVKKLGGDPVQEANYDFGYSTPSEFLGVAQALENTGVAAYKGAAGTVTADAVFNAAISIHSVEARHASFLNELNVESPFPAGVDQPLTMAEVQEIAGQFIVEE